MRTTPTPMFFVSVAFKGLRNCGSPLFATHRRQDYLLHKSRKRRYPPIVSDWIRGRTVTIAAGFHVEDGFLFCSDTEGATESLRLFKRKVLSPTVGDCKYMYTGAGDSDFISMAAQKIEQELHAHPVSTFEEFATVVEDVIVKIHERNIAAFPDDAKPSFSMIFGVLLNGKMQLIRTNATSVIMSSHYECVGSGSVLGRFILDKLYCPTSEIVHVSIAAIYMLQQARKYSPGCGGHSHIFCLREDGTWGIVSSKEIEAWETFFGHAEGVGRSFITAYNRSYIAGTFHKSVRNVLKEAQHLPKPFSEFRWIDETAY